MKSPITYLRANRELFWNISLPALLLFSFSLFLEKNTIPINHPSGEVLVFSEHESVPAIPSSSTAMGSPVVDSLALVALYNSTDGANWTNTWDLGQPMATWYGVTVDGAGCVTCLDLDGVHSCADLALLPGNNLTGNIPPEIGNLSNLTSLSLAYNNLVGSIPASIGNLVNLTFISLGNNQLTGNIPVEIGNLTGLITLSLRNNQLEGNIPQEIGNLTNLTGLELASNMLTGNIPIEIGNLINLTGLFLDSNELSGNIPSEIGNLTSLTYLGLHYNQLDGNIPPEIGNLTSLFTLYLFDNQLSGTIPSEVGNLVNLSSFEVFANQISGSIPPEIGNLINLEYLSFFSNQLNGALPTELGNLTNLITLRLESNALTGTIPASMGNMLNLTFLGLAQNQLSGSIPPELGNLTNLTVFSLENNQLAGSIPIELGNLANLTVFSLENNQLAGSIPIELGNLTNLTGLNLSNNQLSGSIPTELSNLTNLTNLQLQINQLSGPIPSSLANLTNLNTLFLNANQLSGSIPSGLSNLTNLTNLQLQINQLSGPIPTSLANLTNLNFLFLNANQLSGTIPTGLGNLINLTSLDLSDNQLTGSIPTTLGNLTNLNFLDLYTNQLSGTIPMQLGDLTNLFELRAENNQLNGCFPENLFNLCSITNINFSNNPMLPWQGDFSMFCATTGDIADQLNAPCSDNNAATSNDAITANCTCEGVACALVCNPDTLFFPVNAIISASDLLLSSTGCTGPYELSVPAVGDSGTSLFLDCGQYQPFNYYDVTVTNLDFGVSCNVVVMTFDDIAPFPSCVPNITVELDESGQAFVDPFVIDAGSFDNCFSYFPFLDISNFNCNDLGANIVTLFLTDDSGNTSSCESTVFIIDNMIPEWDVNTLPPDAFYECPSDMPDPVDPVSIDNCFSQIVSYVQSSTTPSNCSSDPTIVFRTWIASDEAGNTIDYTQTIELSPDDQWPEFVGLPLDDVVECDDIPSVPILGIDYTVMDNCDPDPMVNFFETNTQNGDPSTAGFYNYTILRSWNTSDNCFNSNAVNQTITVEDTTSPTATINNISDDFFTFSTDPGLCEAFVILDLTEVTDNCAAINNLSISNNSFNGNGSTSMSGIYQEGFYEFEFFLTDPVGNDTFISVIIVVEDLEAPTISNCPADISVNIPIGQGSEAVSWDVPIPIDNCGIETFLGTHNPGDNFLTGTTMVTYTATDNNGNTSSCSFNVTVSEVPPCFVDLPNDIISCPDVPQTLDAGAGFDNYLWSTGSTSQSITIPGMVQGSSMSYSVEVSCGSGLTATDQLTIFWEDTEPPVFDGLPDDITVECTDIPELPFLGVDYFLNDNCDSDPNLQFTETTTQDANTTAIGHYNYTITRSWLATDNVGNTTSVSQVITVQDTTNPTATLNNGGSTTLTINNDPGQCSAIVTMFLETIFDNCAAPSDLTITNDALVGNGSDDASGVYPVGVHNINFTIIDPAGNSTMEVVTLNVIDNEAPSISCPADVIINIPTGQGSGVANWPLPDVNDNCGSLSLIGTSMPGDIFLTGTTIVTYVATDNSGLSSSCNFSVVMIESDCAFSMDDVSACSEEPVTLDAGAGYIAYDWDGLSSNQTLELPGMMSGTETYNVTVTCPGGITATEMVTVSWDDNTAPAITCEDITLELNANCEAFLSIDDFGDNFFDNCTSTTDLILSAQLSNTGPFQDTGVFVVEVTVMDLAGNQATCESNVIVENNLSFFGQCFSNLTYELDDTGNYDLDPADVLQAIAANCSVDLQTDINSFTCQDIGTTTVTLTASNNTGNSFSCTSDITIVDNMDPVPTFCLSDTTIVVNASELPYPVDAGLTPVFTDNCNFTVTNSGVTTLPFGPTSLSYIATDDSGNSTICSFEVRMDTIQVANDSQDGSITIIPSESCASFDGNVALATPSFPQPTECGQGGGTRNDVWYFFTAPTEPVTIKVASSAQFQAGVDVYHANQNFIACKAAPEEGIVDSLVLTPGVTSTEYVAGESYYVRVYDVEGNPGTTYFTVYIYVNDCVIPTAIPQQGFHQAVLEYTDVQGWTHYIGEDSLLLSIRREGRDIGHVGDGTFEVSINRDASVYDVSTAPYASINTQYLASGYYWNVTPNYAPGLSLGQDYSIRSYYTNAEYEAMRDTCPDLGMDGHEELTHYKIDGPNNPSAAPPNSHAAITSDMIHFFESGVPPDGYNFSAFGTSNDYAVEMCIIDFSGGGFMYRKLDVGVAPPLSEWSAVSLFPVPTYDDLNLVFTSTKRGKGLMVIYDVMGKRMNQIPLHYEKGKNEKVMSIHHLPAGVYFLKLIDEEGLYTTLRFVKSEG